MSGQMTNGHAGGGGERSVSHNVAAAGQRRRRTRPNRRRRNRRHSFAASTEDGELPAPSTLASDLNEHLFESRASEESGLYGLGQPPPNRSTNLDPEALLDHRYRALSNCSRMTVSWLMNLREHRSIRPRRQSLAGQNSFGPPINASG